MYIQRKTKANTKYEYGCDLRRLYPWDKVVDPLWGAAIASVRPGESTDPHRHDELETFIVISGQGVMLVGSEKAELGQGDVVYIPRNETHSFQNISAIDELVFLTIYWDSPESLEKMKSIIHSKETSYSIEEKI
ncbi:cupin domain-containing protein [Endozoicomonas sp. ALB115]|uniref:cupin domain-containing protein n=1 Tax=Endozoicomonas sp. ALB115 TaxID=3403074 RepID=UPI003BB5541D